MNKSISFFLCISLIFIFSSFSLEGNRKRAPFISVLRDTTLVLGHDSVDLLFPSVKPIGQILVLPGWNYSRKKCCSSSSFCTQALRMGYLLILPEMGKSVYASRRYPETRKDWARYPELSWVMDTLITYLQQNLAVLRPGQNNFIFGISTGGRGVALILERSSLLFKAGAALSGDYDQTLFPGDNLMKGFYGEYNRFPERWEGEDNPLRNVKKLEVPLYLGHGLDDQVVPSTQTSAFYSEFRRIQESGKKPEAAGCRIHLAEHQQHNYAYWESETAAILQFFAR